MPQARYYVAPYVSGSGPASEDEEDASDEEEPEVHMHAPILHTIQAQSAARDEEFLHCISLRCEAASRDADFLAEVHTTLDTTPHTAFRFDRVRHFQPEFVPRRKKLTHTACMQTIWQAKHGVTDVCMDDFLAMTRHRKFNAEDLRSGQQVRRTRERFPLLPLFSLDVQQNILPFYDEEGVYTSSTTVEFPFFALAEDVIPRFLNTLDSLDSLTVAAKHGPFAEEQWHGRIFRENPLFTISRVTTNQDSVVALGENWKFLASDETEQLCMITGIALDEDSAEIKVGDLSTPVPIELRA